MTTTAANTSTRVGDLDQLARLLLLRTALIEEQGRAGAPAVSRALEMADFYLFLALGYFGYDDKLFPEQR